MLVRDVRDNSAALDDYLYDKDLNPTLIPRTTVWQNMRDFWTNTSDHLSHLRYVLANDEDIAIRQSSDSARDAYADDFVSSSGSAAPSASDIGSAASSVSDLKSAFSSSASGRDAFNGFTGSSSDDRWGWFSQDCLDSLDTSSSSGRRYLKSSSGGFTNFSSEYYNEVMNYVTP